MSRRQAIEVIEERYVYPKRRRPARRKLAQRYPIIGCIDLRCSRDDQDRMEAAAKRAGVTFDDWASAMLVRAVRTSRRRKGRSL